MIGVKKNVIVFFGLFLIGMLFVPTGIPFMVPEAEASNHQTTEAECLGAISNDIIAYYTAVTCENPFNVTVNIGQRLRITNPSGSYDDMLPIATYGGLGTYQYSGNVGGVSTTGTITIQNQPNVGVNYVDTTATISGSQVNLNGQIVNNNSFPVKTYSYYHVTDDAGNYVTSWLITGNDDATILVGVGSTTFSTTVCCLPNNDGTQVTPYILQAIRDHVSPYSLPSGTPLIDVNVYPAAQSGPPSGTVSTTGITLNADDGGDCSTVGTWDSSNNTCTLTADINITSTSNSNEGAGIYISYVSTDHIQNGGLTLDGAGHTITGAGTTTYGHNGVHITGQSAKVTIKNLAITNFHTGVASYNTNGFTVTGLTITNVGPYGIYLTGNDGVTVESNTISSSGPGYAGIAVQGYGNANLGNGNGSCTGNGQYVSSQNDGPIVIKNNQLTNSNIDISQGYGYCVQGNVVTNGVISIGGLSWDQSVATNHIVKNNQVTGRTTGTGFTIQGDGNTVEGNTANSNESGFTFTQGAKNNIITNNVANNNQRYGFLFTSNDLSGTGHTFTGNTASGNGWGDIEGISTSNVDLSFSGPSPAATPYPTGETSFARGVGTGVQTQIQITNTGTGTANPVWVNVKVLAPNGSVFAEQYAMTGSAIGPNNPHGMAWSHNVFDSSTVLGTYSYTITIDPDNLVAETNENNNVHTGTFVVVEGEQLPVDLSFSGPSPAATPYPTGETSFARGVGTGVQTQIQITNTGTGTANPVWVNVKVLAPNGSVFAEQYAMTGSAIGPNNPHGMAWSHNVFDSSTVLGTYSYTITIDPDNLVAETNENNNVHTGTFVVVEGEQLPVDLSFSGPSPAATPYPTGETSFARGVGTGVQTQIQITNTGTGTANPVWVNVKVLAPNGSVFAEQYAMTGSAIGPNNPHGMAWSHNVFDSSTVLGTYSYTITIDPDNLVAETNENNNVHTGTFVVVEEGVLAWTPQSFEDYNQNLKAIDVHDNKLYGIQYSSGNIVIFDLAADQMAIIETQGMGDGDLNYPSDVAADDSGNIYVVEQAGGQSGRLLKFDSNGNFGWSASNFVDPATGVAVDNSGNIYVTTGKTQPNSVGQIKKFDSNGNLLLTFGSMPSTNGCFVPVAPQTIEFGPNGYLWVGVGNGCTIPWTGNNWNGVAKIQKYSTSGSLLSSFGESGVYESFTDSSGVYHSDTPGDGEFGQYGVSSIAFDGGYMFVADSDNARIQKLTLDGTFVEVYNLFETSGSTTNVGWVPQHLAADNGNFYLVGNHYFDTDKNSIYTYSTLEILADTSLDTTPPIITVENLTNSTGSSTGKEIFFVGSDGNSLPMATDNLGVTDITCTHASGSTFPVGVTTVTCTAYDSAENEATASFTVTVNYAPGAPFTITDDSTGGDCQHIGTWDSGTKTCTLTGDVTADLSDGIIIGSDGITLDGSGYSIIGPGFGPNTVGVKVDGKFGVTLKNFTVKDFGSNIQILNSNFPTLSNLTITGAKFGALPPTYDSGMLILNTTNLTMSDSTQSSVFGLDILGSSGITIQTSNLGRYVYLEQADNIEISNNSHTSGEGILIGGETSNVNIHDNNPIRNVQGGHFICSSNSYLSSTGQVGDSASQQWASWAPAPLGCYYSHGSGIKINNNVVTEAILAGLSTGPWEITGNTVDRIGISWGNSDNNLWGTGGHTISNNMFVPSSNSNNQGLSIYGNHGNTISDNTFQGKGVGIWLVGSKNNIITNNNFILNGDDVMLIKSQNSYPSPQPPTASTGNTFSQNYWDSFDSAGETCYNDSPFDKYCDITYSGSPTTTSYNNAPVLDYQDSQPWVMQDGAMPSSPIPSPPDTQDPSVSTPGSQTFYTTNQSGMIVNYGSVTASDDRAVTSGPTCTHASGTTFAVGNTPVTCTAYDAAGNEGTGTFTITVVYNELDVTDPVVTTPDNIYSQTTNPQGAVVTFSNGTATDNIGVTSGPNCYPMSGTVFPIGNSTVTCTAYDAEGNSGLASFWILLTQTFVDTAAPYITTPSSQTITTTSTSGKTFFYDMPTATDNIGVTSGPNCSPVSGTLLPVGVTTITCTASDGSGNTSTASFTVTVVNTAATGDTTPPTVSHLNSILKETTLSNGAVVTYSLPTATDDEAVTYGPVCTPSSGSLFSIGSTTVTCIAKDAAGNQGTSSFSVIVVQPSTAIEEGTVSLQLDKSSYFTGDPINITGAAIGGVADVTLRVVDPNGNLISVSQVTPESGTVSQSSGTQATVQNAPGSSFEGCEPNCFLPNPVTIDAGGTVTWENPDDVPHTVTSGSPFGGPDGYFNSGLISVGSSFSHQFNASGTYNYYCIVHPWMQSSVFVSGSASTQPEESGSFTTQILTLGPLWSEDGNYIVEASYGPATATKTFNFTVRALDAIPFTSVPSDIALSINKNNYTGDETISINALLVDGSAGQPISIQVSDPVGVPLFLQTLNTDSQARISTQFTLPENVVSGTYTVSASSMGALWDLEDSAAFTGIPLEPEVLDSSISATDEQGENVTTYNAGDLGYFSTKMTTKSTSQILVTVNVFDAQQNALGVGFFKTVLPKGDAEIVLGFEIPEGTISGDAQIFTNFFTDWPDQGGISIGEEINSIVNIIGVEPVEEEPQPVVESELSQMQIIVQNAPDSSTPGCEETNSCFLPFVAEVDVGGIVTWENPDNVPHTVTSGTSAIGPDGHFDSTLMQVGDSFSHTFDNEGTYNYFCMVHPWMQGSIVVGGSDLVVVPIIEPEPVVESEQIEPEPVIEESSGMQATVQNAPGSSFEGCEETNSCFLPYTVTIDAGGTVTWENPDNFPHTVTSGTSAIGPDGHFDSNLIMVGESFSNTFAEAGTYNYFCMIHPWMEGKVVVAGSEMTVEPVIEQESSGTQVIVQNAPGSSFEGCEPNCFLPNIVIIDAGGTVTWENPDDAAHTTTSFKGSISGVIGLEWDSGLMLRDQSFSHTFDTEGTYDYFCMVHPWMQGQVVVQAEEEEVSEPIEEEVVEVADILSLNATSNIIQLSDAEYVWVDKPSLNDVYEKLTISSWVKPNFMPIAGPQYSAVSKEGSFELFLTNTKEPTTSPGFSVFDGIVWNTILIDSKVPDGWHHLTGVVDENELSLYLDSVLIGTESMPPHYVFNDQGQSVPQTAYMDTSENNVIVGALINSVNPSQLQILHSFEGSISDVNIITDALNSEQVSNLYDKDKDMFQRGLIEIQSVINGTITTTFATTESPKLSVSECTELANESELDYNDNYTLVCEFPFDVIIPINSRILWIETLDLEDAPYHSIRSVDDIFGTGSMVSADMGFYDDVFTYGVYEYYDDFDESLTGKIIISKPTNNIDINEGSIFPGCADNYSCYDTFAAQVNVGEEVTWANQDTEVHTITSGTPADGPDGHFDSGLIENYMYFYHTFDEPGTYDYFCMVHPWMQGKVAVGEI